MSKLCVHGVKASKDRADQRLYKVIINSAPSVGRKGGGRNVDFSHIKNL